MKDYNCAVVYFSRSNTTKKIAERIAGELKADLFQLKADRYPMGLFGFLKGIWRSSRGLEDYIDTENWEIEKYKFLVVGNPVWASKLPPPMRSFLNRYGRQSKDIAFFLTYGGTGAGAVLNEMRNLCGKWPLSMLEISAKDLNDGISEKKIEKFVRDTQSNFQKSIKKVG